MSAPSALSSLAARASRRAALWAIAAPGLLLVAPLLFGWMWGEIDTQRLELPILCALHEQVRLGHGHWLFSLIGNGSPLLGWPSSVLYPLRWFQLLLPLDLATSLHPVIHLLGGAAATAWLARTFRLRVSTSALAGVLFVLSGTALDLVAKPYYAAGALYLPLVWAAARQALAPRGRPVHVLVVGLGLGLELLGGEAHTFGMIAAVLVLELVLARRRRVPWARIAPVALALVAGLLLGWPQWGQTLAEAQLTGRVTGLETTFRWSFRSLGWWSAIWPAVGTTPADPGTMLAQIFSSKPKDPLDWNLRAYVGLLFLCALVSGARRARTRAAAIVFGLFFLAALGDQTPFLPLLHKLVPLLERFRYPAKYLVPAMVGAAVVVAGELGRAVRSPAARRSLLVALATALVGNLLMTLWVFTERDLIDGLAAAWSPPHPEWRLGSLSSWLLRSSMQPTAMALLAVGALLLPPSKRGLLLVVAALDLVAAAPLIVAAHPKLAEMHSPAVVLRAADGAPPADIAVVCAPPRLQGLSIVVEDGAREQVDVRGARLLGVAEMQACDGVAGTWTYAAPLLQRTVEDLKAGLDQANSRAARALGCTHIFDTEAPQGGGVQLAAGFEPGGPYFDPAEGAPRMYRIVDPIPPAFISPVPLWVAEADQRAMIVRTPETLGLLRIVDAPQGDASGELPDGLGTAGLTFDWRVRDEATVTVAGTGGAVVGLRTSYWTGWRAEQAGEPLATVRIAGVQLGAIVPDVARGPIHFRYRPPGWPAALGVAALGLVLLAISAWTRRRAG